jgi:hypothetical protein
VKLIKNHRFEIIVGTALQPLRVRLSTWVRAAHAFSYETSEKAPRSNALA